MAKKVKAEHTLVDIERCALHRIVDGAESNECSAKIGVGDHVFDFTVHVTGLLRKGEDFEQVHAPSLPKMEIIQNLLSRLNGVTIESVVKDVQKELKFNRDPVDPKLEERAKKAWKDVAETQKKGMNGRVSLTEIKVEVI